MVGEEKRPLLFPGAGAKHSGLCVPCPPGAVQGSSSLAAGQAQLCLGSLSQLLSLARAAAASRGQPGPGRALSMVIFILILYMFVYYLYTFEHLCFSVGNVLLVSEVFTRLI